MDHLRFGSQEPTWRPLPQFYFFRPNHLNHAMGALDSHVVATPLEVDRPTSRATVDRLHADPRMRVSGNRIQI